MPGVLLVLTGDDVKADGLGDVPCHAPLNNRDGSPRRDTPRPALAIGKVRHAGQPVALVVAETLPQAQDAAEAIEIDYETLPAVTDARAALEQGAPQLFDGIPGNLVFDWDNDTSDFAATDAAFAKAAHVTTLEIINNRVVANSMEPRNAIGDWDAAAGARCSIPHAGLAFRARSARRGRAENPEGEAARRDAAECRRRLRHEGLRLSRAGAGRVGRREAEAPGALAIRPLGSFPVRQPGPRPLHPRRTCARRTRASSSASASR